MREALEKAGIKLALSPGDIVTVKDSKIKFPLNLLRKPHERRFCVILSNDILCERSPLLSIVPLSHRLELKSWADIPIDKTTDNGLEVDSYAAMEQIQPIERGSVVERKGKLSLDDWDRLLKKMIDNFDRA